LGQAFVALKRAGYFFVVVLLQLHCAPTAGWRGLRAYCRLAGGRTPHLQTAMTPPKNVIMMKHKPTESINLDEVVDNRIPPKS